MSCCGQPSPGPRANSCFMSMIHSVSSASSSDAPAPRNVHCKLCASDCAATELLCRERQDS